MPDFLVTWHVTNILVTFAERILYRETAHVEFRLNHSPVITFPLIVSTDHLSFHKDVRLRLHMGPAAHCGSVFISQSWLLSRMYFRFWKLDIFRCNFSFGQKSYPALGATFVFDRNWNYQFRSTFSNYVQSLCYLSIVWGHFVATSVARPVHIYSYSSPICANCYSNSVYFTEQELRLRYSVYGVTYQHLALLLPRYLRHVRVSSTPMLEKF